MRAGIRIARIAGIDVVVDVSVVLLAAALAWALDLDVSLALPGVSPTRALAVGIIGGLLFLGGVLVHELSHSLVALRHGLVVRGIRLFVFGGYSIIEPEAGRPEDEFVVAAAGPVASLALAALFFAASLLGGTFPALGRVFLSLAVANLAIGVFNLLPGFPLDGGRVLRAFLWRRSGDRVGATHRAILLGRVIGVVVAAVGVFLVVGFLEAAGLWWAAVGWFLFRGAEAAGRRERLLARVGGLRVRDVMRPVRAAVPGAMAVTHVEDRYGTGSSWGPLPVEVEGRVVGLIGAEEVEDLSPARRATTPARAAMTPIGPEDVTAAEAPLDEVLPRFAGGRERMVVVSGARVVGVLTVADVGRVLGATGDRDPGGDLAGG